MHGVESIRVSCFRDFENEMVTLVLRIHCP